MISIIIPTLNEAASAPKLIEYLRRCPLGNTLEIIVIDGNSNDGTYESLSRKRDVVIARAERGRARQMNAGAQLARGDVFYFLHADSFPPPTFVSDIMRAVGSGWEAGCYRLKFDEDHWFLRFNAWFTRFRFTPVRFGDQSLFVSRTAFERVGGFSDVSIMEDQEMVRRIVKVAKFIVLRKRIVTSARRYTANGIYRLQFLYFILYFLCRIGVSQPKLLHFYSRWIR